MYFPRARAIPVSRARATPRFGVLTTMIRGALRIATQEPGRTVRGTVVHDDSLEIPERLRQNRLQARIEIPFQIVSGDDYRNLGRG